MTRHRPMRESTLGDPTFGLTNKQLAAAREVIGAEIRLARFCKSILDRHYPGYIWHVDVDFATELAKISLPVIMPSYQSFVVPLSKIAPSPQEGERAVMRAGAEILERFKLPRGPINFDRFQEVRKAQLIVPGRPLPIPS